METAGPHVLWVEEEDGCWLGRDGRNILRYLNHHEEPSAEFDGFELYALRDIPAGKEITIHYGEEFVEAIANGEV
jgi:SET domain-containing protein